MQSTQTGEWKQLTGLTRQKWLFVNKHLSSPRNLHPNTEIRAHVMHSKVRKRRVDAVMRLKMSQCVFQQSLISSQNQSTSLYIRYSFYSTYQHLSHHNPEGHLDKSSWGTGSPTPSTRSSLSQSSKQSLNPMVPNPRVMLGAGFVDPFSGQQLSIRENRLIHHHMKCVTALPKSFTSKYNTVTHMPGSFPLKQCYMLRVH